MAENKAQLDRNQRSVLAAGIWIGIGMGGFVDGILFHQILQLHSLVSNWIPRSNLVNEQINMFWDGIFHAFTWITTGIGISKLWRSLRYSGTNVKSGSFVGATLFGWGLFNVVEGVIDHQLFQLHHVYQNGSHLIWDFVFLAFGALLLLVGWSLMRRVSPS